jgi:uncharacterized membrane protein YgcG
MLRHLRGGSLVESGGFARTYGVELICPRPPEIIKAELYAALRGRCPRVKPLDGGGSSSGGGGFSSGGGGDFGGGGASGDW